MMRTESVRSTTNERRDERVSGAAGLGAQIVPFLVLAVVGVAIPIALAHAYGALDIPRSDSWSYLHTLFEWRRTGHWDFNHWVSMTLVGQIFMAVPIVAVFGYSVTAVNVAFAFVGLAGLAALMWLGQIVGLSPWKSALVGLCVAASPLWGPLAPTFMTDIPAFVFQILALALACASFRREEPSLRLLGASIAVGFVAISIRQYSVIPVAAILLASAMYFARLGDRRRLGIVVALGVAVVVGTLALLAWWHTVPNGKALAIAVPSGSSLSRTYNNSAGFLRLTGVILSPLLLLVGPVSIVRRAFRRDRRIATITLVASAFWIVTGYVPSRPLVGNYFDARGVLADNLNLPGLRPRIMPALAFDLIAVIGCIAAVLLLLAAVPWIADRTDDFRSRRLPPMDPIGAILGLTVAGSVVVYGLAIATEEPIFDRYALSTLPIVGLLLLRSARARDAAAPPEARVVHRRSALTAGALVVLGLVGMAYAAESASFDATRWRLAEKVVAAGYAPEQIAAGDEWIGWYRDEGPPTAGTVGGARQVRPEYYRGLCVTVRIDAHELPPKTIATAVSHAPTRKPSLFVAYRNDAPCATPGDGKGP
jgi:hypothetical protein